METLIISNGEIGYDFEQTKKNYGGYKKYSCDCKNCQDFFKVIDEILPREFIGLLDKLGVDYKKPIELWSTYNANTYEEGFVDWGGWYNFTGKVIPTNGEKEILIKFNTDENFHEVTIQDHRVFCFIKSFKDPQAQIEFYWKGNADILGKSACSN